MSEFKKQLIINIVWNLVHTAWQLVVVILATIKFGWAGFGISFAALLVFNIVESLVFHIIARIRGRKADLAYKATFE
jgi:hypothetical protein